MELPLAVGCHVFPRPLSPALKFRLPLKQLRLHRHATSPLLYLYLYLPHVDRYRYRYRYYIDTGSTYVRTDVRGWDPGPDRG